MQVSPRRGFYGWDASGYNATGWDKAIKVRRPKGILRAHTSPADRVISSITPIGMNEPKTGVFIHDMGQNFSGWIRLKVKGKSGTKVIMLEEHYSGMKHWLEYMGTCTEDDYIVVREEEGSWCLGDWCVPKMDEEDEAEILVPLVNTFVYATVAGLMARIAEVLGKRDDVDSFSRLRHAIVEAFHRCFYDEDNGYYSIGRHGSDAFGLMLKPLPEEARDRVLENLIHTIAVRNNGHLDTGIVGTPVLLDVLTDYGYTDVLMKETYPSYGYMTAQGATTMWETWSGSGSHCHHMFGCVSGWFFKVLAGIQTDPEGAGFEKIIIKPHIIRDIATVSAAVKTLRGRIAVSWRKENEQFFLKVEIPGNSTARIFFPKLETANIDALAERGMMFTNAYAANPLCSPTRASIMTGLWPARVGITTPSCHIKEEILHASLVKEAPHTQKALPAISASRLRLEYPTLAEAFKEEGYTTAHIGKWHLGPEPYDPFHQGFDVDIPHTPAPSPLPDGWFAPWPVWPGEGEPGEHLEDRMAQEAVKFVKEHKNEPFYLNFWLFSVHSPWHAKNPLIEKYKRKIDPQDPQHNPVYAGMVETMDDAVGTVIKALDEEGLTDKTIVIFFSDNGGVHWGVDKHVHPDYVDVPITSQSPMRGGKATIYEGGTREPLIVAWPEHVKPGNRNEQAIIQSVDFFPTLADMCQLDTKAAEPFDGVSFLPALQRKPLERDTIFCHFPHYVKATGEKPSTYVRKGNWKLIRFYCDGDDQSDRFELYNLEEDIGETTNLADKFPGKVREMDTLISQFLENSGAIVPMPNSAYQHKA